jgi:hypothetical protein
VAHSSTRAFPWAASTQMTKMSSVIIVKCPVRVEGDEEDDMLVINTIRPTSSRSSRRGNWASWRKSSLFQRLRSSRPVHHRLADRAVQRAGSLGGPVSTPRFRGCGLHGVSKIGSAPRVRLPYEDDAPRRAHLHTLGRPQGVADCRWRWRGGRGQVRWTRPLIAR